MRFLHDGGLRMSPGMEGKELFRDDRWVRQFHFPCAVVGC
jgi:hypothetical protein